MIILCGKIVILSKVNNISLRDTDIHIYFIGINSSRMSNIDVGIIIFNIC